MPWGKKKTTTLVSTQAERKKQKKKKVHRFLWQAGEKNSDQKVLTT